DPARLGDTVLDDRRRRAELERDLLDALALVPGAVHPEHPRRELDQSIDLEPPVVARRRHGLPPRRYRSESQLIAARCAVGVICSRARTKSASAATAVGTSLVARRRRRGFGVASVATTV